MKKKEITNVLHGYFITLKKHFKTVQQDFTAEKIKPFRIEIKKLRAFLRLLATRIKEPGDLRLEGPLKEMHKSGGRFRDLQLHQQRLQMAIKKKTGIRYSPGLLDTAKKEIKKEKDRFLSNRNFGVTEKELQKHLPDHYNTTDLRKFLREKIDVIAGIITARQWTDKEMHDIRKKLKDILYIVKLYSTVLKKHLGFRFWSKAQLEQIKKIEDELGFFNDTRNALTLLEPGWINEQKGEDKKLLVALRRNLLAKKRRQKEKLIASLGTNILKI